MESTNSNMEKKFNPYTPGDFLRFDGTTDHVRAG